MDEGTAVANLDGKVSAKGWLKEATPPFIWRIFRRIAGLEEAKFFEYEYLPGGWRTGKTDGTQGWNVESVLKSNMARWPMFERRIAGSSPIDLALSQTSLASNPTFHNSAMTFAYVVGRVAHLKSQISVFDWGGGIGHYYAIARQLLPDVRIKYFCRDLPLFVEQGCKLFPDARFLSDDSWRELRFDLVMSSVAFQYAHNWKELFAKLAYAAISKIFITGLPVVATVPSFVFVQRPDEYGYDTEYASWALNRFEFIEHGESLGWELEREFVCHSLDVHAAPERPELRGFLFQPKKATVAV